MKGFNLDIVKKKLYFFVDLVVRIVRYPLFKKKLLLENSFGSDHYFKKILPEIDFYFNKFKEVFFKNNPFCFVDDIERKSICNEIENTLPEYKEKIISKAESIMQNRFNILNIEYQFQNKLNWFYSFFDDYYWPFKRTEKIQYILEGQNDIDIKYSLRLSYHQEFVILGLAYFLTNNEKYTFKFIELILDWIKKNPPNFGINWIDLLEISHRVISWIISLSLFKNSRSITKNHFKLIAKSLYQQIFYIKLNSDKKSFNHVIGEYFTIFLFSKIFKDIYSINKWYKKAKKVLIQQIDRQIQEDGVHIEQSTHYHCLVLEIFILLLVIEPKIIPTKELKLIEKMFEYLRFLIKPNGDLPLVGDSDDAHFIPTIFFNNEKFYTQDLLNLGAVLFNRQDFILKYNDDKIPLILMLLGNAKFKIYEEMKPFITKDNIKYFSRSGYVIGKSNWTNKSNYLFFDMGHFSSGSSGHDHSDISNLIYSFRGKPILIDSGTYMYNIPLNRRNIFRTNKAHNIISINNKNQALPSGIWEWKDQPKIKRKFFRDKNYLYAIIEHNGHKNFKTRRQLIASNNLNKIEIIDLIIPTKNFRGESTVSSFFHFPKDISLEISGNIISINSYLILEIKNGNNRFKIMKKTFPYSPYYGVKKKSHLIEVKINHNFSDGKNLRLFYYIYPKEKNI